jgi:dolichol-phosphate mannosyltransferase
MNMRLGVVIPAYCEEENIAQLCSQISEVIPSAKILVVDDSPNELSVMAINNLGIPNVRIIHRGAKSGRGSAVLFGICELVKSDVDCILEIDADFSHPPTQIPELVEFAISRHTDLLIASRYLKTSEIKGWPLSRRAFSLLANRLARVCLQVPVKDYTNGYRLYSNRAAKEIVNSCGKLGDGFIILSEILVTLYFKGFKVEEVPTVFVNRVRGVSSLGYKEVFSAAKGLMKITLLRIKLQR